MAGVTPLTPDSCLLTPVLIAGAAVGHVAILAYAINLLYGTRFRGLHITLARNLLGLLVLAGLFWIVVDGGWWTVDGEGILGTSLSTVHRPPSTLLRIYVALCWVVGLVLVPLVTVRRWLRRTPAQQLSNHTLTVDVAGQLGRRPLGSGSLRNRWLAYFPGNQIFQVDLVEQTFRMPQLPLAWDGLTILHLTDLHLCGTPDRDYYEHVLDRCREPVPDLVAITGDILDRPPRFDWVLPLLGRLRWQVGAFAIFGNHDCETDLPRLRGLLDQLGIESMGGRWKTVLVRGQPLIILGNELPWLPPAPDLADCPSEGFRLCLSHTPDTLPWARQQRIDLVLAGHNHGGQVRIPGFGPVLVPSIYSRRYDCGVFYEAPTLMYVGRGLGGTQPLRWGCRPEVTRIVLRK
jgi:predicted MPP superfamily phosphohydrolase